MYLALCMEKLYYAKKSTPLIVTLPLRKKELRHYYFFAFSLTNFLTGRSPENTKKESAVAKIAIR